MAWQDKSHYGNKEDVWEKIRHYESDPKIILTKFEPDLYLNPKANEKLKLQQRIDIAKEIGATHIFPIAEDHYYEKEDFIWAKQFIEMNNIDGSATRMYTYYKHPTWQVTLEGVLSH